MVRKVANLYAENVLDWFLLFTLLNFWVFFHPFFVGEERGGLVPPESHFLVLGFLDREMLGNVFSDSYTLQRSTESKGVSEFAITCSSYGHANPGYLPSYMGVCIA